MILSTLLKTWTHLKKKKTLQELRKQTVQFNNKGQQVSSFVAYSLQLCIKQKEQAFYRVPKLINTVLNFIKKAT